MAVIGLIPTAAIFVVIFMRLEGPERWKLVIPYVTVLIPRDLAGLRQIHGPALAADPARLGLPVAEGDPVGLAVNPAFALQRRWCEDATPAEKCLIYGDNSRFRPQNTVTRFAWAGIKEKSGLIFNLIRLKWLG